MNLRLLLNVTLCVLFLDAISGAFAEAKADHFRDTVAPFFKKHCLDCHDAQTKENDLDLTGYVDAAGVVRDRKVWMNVLQLVRDHEMPPAEHDPQPAVDEREAFVAGLRKLFREADAGKPRDPGPALIRRLNRTEYDNTIRDLFHIDYQASVAFPPDDRHHGFENIAESLSLSPVLMERYLEAAEKVVARGLAHGDQRKPPVYVGFKQYMDRGTNIPYAIGVFTSTPLRFEFQLAAAGSYSVEIHGKPLLHADPPAKTELRLNGEKVAELVFEKGEGRPDAHSVPLKLPRGHHVLELVLLNPNKEQEAKKDMYPSTPSINNKEKLRGYGVYRFNLIGPTEAQPERYREIMASDATDAEGQAREIIARFTSLAFRRPASEVEVEQYVAVFQAAQQRDLAFDQSIGAAMQAILISPHFLFRVEAGPPPQTAKPQPVSDYHLATRLSYFLWSSIPDEELLTLAAKGELHANLETQVKRMLDDWRAAAFIENFVPQWLEISDIDKVSRTNRRFEPRMRVDMTRETLRFAEAVLRENRPITDFLDGRFTFLNERLVRHYGLQNYYEQQGIVLPKQPLVRVSLPADGVRAGILTHGSVLTMTAAPTRTSPVKRGAWILENILAKPPPPPPPDVPPLDEKPTGDQEKMTLRQRLEVHRDNAQCAVCHNRIDPIGFALERFSNIGQFREKYDRRDPGDNRGAKVDDIAELPSGRKLEGVKGLREVLIERPEQFTRCLTEKVLIYALGRGLEESDIPTVDDIAEAVANDDYRFQTLIHEVTQSAPFRQRRGKES